MIRTSLVAAAVFLAPALGSAETMTDALGCRSKEDIVVFTDLGTKKDYTAFEALYRDRIASGKCVRFHGGETVSIVESPMMSFSNPVPMTKVQPAEGGEPVWVLSKMISN